MPVLAPVSGNIAKFLQEVQKLITSLHTKEIQAHSHCAVKLLLQIVDTLQRSLDFQHNIMYEGGTKSHGRIYITLCFIQNNMRHNSGSHIYPLQYMSSVRAPLVFLQSTVTKWLLRTLFHVCSD
jgi:hypothetical protein